MVADRAIPITWAPFFATRYGNRLAAAAAILGRGFHGFKGLRRHNGPFRPTRAACSSRERFAWRDRNSGPAPDDAGRPQAGRCRCPSLPRRPAPVGSDVAVRWSPQFGKVNHRSVSLATKWLFSRNTITTMVL